MSIKRSNKTGQFLSKVAIEDAPAKVVSVETVSIDENHPVFGDFVSDDDSFEPEATYITVKSKPGKFGIFVGDGQSVIISFGVIDNDVFWGSPVDLSPKEAKRFATHLIAAAKQAKKEKKRQEAHLASLPMKKSKGK